MSYDAITILRRKNNNFPGSTSSKFTHGLHKLVELVNEQRARVGLTPLIHTRELDDKARVRATWLVTNKCPSTSWFSSSSKRQIAAPVYHIKHGIERPVEVYNALISRSSTKKDVCNYDFSLIGIGIAYGSDGRIVVCMVFSV